MDTIPDELVLHIIDFLHIADINSLSQICNKYHQLINTSFTWNRLYRRDYKGNLVVDVDKSSWKEAYKRKAIHNRWLRGKPTVRTFCYSHTKKITCMFLHTDDPTVIITGAEDGLVKLWDSTTGMCIDSLSGHSAGILRVYCDASRLISAAHDNVIKIWDRDTEAPSKPKYKLAKDITAVDIHIKGFCVDRSMGIMAFTDGDKCKLWDFCTETVIKEFYYGQGFFRFCFSVPGFLFLLRRNGIEVIKVLPVDQLESLTKVKVSHERGIVTIFNEGPIFKMLEYHGFRDDLFYLEEYEFNVDSASMKRAADPERQFTTEYPLSSFHVGIHQQNSSCYIILSLDSFTLFPREGPSVDQARSIEFGEHVVTDFICDDRSLWFASSNAVYEYKFW